MRSTRSRSIIVYLLGAVAIIGIIIFIFEYFMYGNVWATSYINRHISTNGNLTTAGKVLDRNEQVLAQTTNSKRTYNSDYNTRCAMLHVVGDDSNAISTAVQSAYRYQLIGYNPITGIGLNSIFGNGNDVFLTLDSNICSKVSQALGNYSGTALMYNYKTGEILCMVSNPTYDPQNPPDIENDTTGKYNGVYLNRALSSSLTPGSVFKIITCAAAIDNIPDIYSRTFHCDGSIDVNGDKITCMGHHGDIDFVEGMSQSCNIVFAQIAMELGIDKMTDEVLELGFNKNIYLDDIKLSNSNYESGNVKQSDLGWSGIGQYKDLVNPMHMAIIIGAIANKGVPVLPYMVQEVATPLGIPIDEGYAKLGDRLLSEETSSKLRDIMRYTVKDNYGDNMFQNLTVCAKTGTGEVEGKEPNSWMVGFSLDEDCPLAFVVAVEDAGYGSKVAAPIAKTMMQQGAALLRENKGEN